MVPNLLVYHLLMFHSFCLSLNYEHVSLVSTLTLSIWCRLEWQMMANWMVLIWTYMQIVVPALMILMWVMLKHWLTMVTSILLYTYWHLLTENLWRKYFHTQMSSSQSEERTMFFTREKKDTSYRNRERCFFTCEKNDAFNQKPQRCVSFASKFPPFCRRLHLAAPSLCELLRKHSTRNDHKVEFLSWKSEKHLGNGIEIVLYPYTKNSTFDEENWREPTKQQRKLYQKSHLFAALTRLISDTSTTRG